MKGKKEFLARILYYSGIYNIAKFNNNSRLIVFNYHRIRPDDNSFDNPFDDDVFGATVSQFEEQIKWLKQNVKILSEKELIDVLDAKRAPSGLNVLITFDDGYIDNYTLAYPVLKKLKVPAIFFIPTNLINTRQVGWWDIIAYLIKNTKKPYIILEDKKFLLQEKREKAISFFNNKMKSEKAEKTANLLKTLAEVCEVDMPDFDKQDSQLMTWEQIREVSNNNISIGSHTHVHRVLSTLDTTCQKEEIILSKTILEQQTGQNIKSISYPVGGYKHFTEETKHIAKQAGHELGFSFHAGINNFETISSFDIKRLGAPNSVVMLSLTTILPKIICGKSRLIY